MSQGGVGVGQRGWFSPPPAPPRSWQDPSGCVMMGSPEVIWTPQPTLTPHPPLHLQLPLGLLPPFLCPGLRGAVSCTPLSPEGVRAEGGSVSAGPVEEAEGWVYPGRQPRKPEHVIKRLYLLGSVFWDKSSQCCLRPVTCVWALRPLLPGSALSL